MSEINIIEVKSSRDKKRFLEFPWELYKKDPLWIPPLRIEQKELVGYTKSPFYEHNAVQTFLAVRDGKSVGRIAAIDNVGHTEKYDDNLGFFGFFDCEDDQKTASGLFFAAENWLKARGLDSIRGPINPSLNHTLGLLIEGFDTSPFFMMTYNPPYYEKLIENYGFTKSQDLYAYWGHIEMLPKVREKLAPISEMIIERCNVTVRTVNKKRFREDVEMFLRIYNQSLTNTWGFVPMSEAEVKSMAAGLRYLMVPELAVVVEIEGKPVGAAFCLPDYNPRIKAINGKLFPFGFLRLIWRKDRIKKLRIISTNVLPEYQMLGLGLVLVDALVPKAIEWGIQEAEFSWVLESNNFSRGSLEKGGAKRSKTYRIYDKAIG